MFTWLATQMQMDKEEKEEGEREEGRESLFLESWAKQVAVVMI